MTKSRIQKKPCGSAQQSVSVKQLKTIHSRGCGCNRPYTKTSISQISLRPNNFSEELKLKITLLLKYLIENTKCADKGYFSLRSTKYYNVAVLTVP